jgi:hypothetical protein
MQAFANSPPWWMTVSGSVTGSEGGKTDNLRVDEYAAFVAALTTTSSTSSLLCFLRVAARRTRYAAFAKYLAAVAEHFDAHWNVTFDTVTPLNEPGAGWWKHGNQQEGCHFDRASQVGI